jgi:transposase
MNIFKNARLTPLRREEMARAVMDGLPVAQAASRYGVCPKIVRRWTNRFKAEGQDGMADRSSRPCLSPAKTEKAVSAITFLKAAVAYYESLGISVTRIMTDNGSCYRAKYQTLHAKDKRQGRTLHQDSLDGMGLCPSLSFIRNPQSQSPAMDPHVQLASTTQQPKIKNTYQSARSKQGQRIEAPHLEQIVIKKRRQSFSVSKKSFILAKNPVDSGLFSCEEIA